MPKVLNKHHYKTCVLDAVYIGRGSVWGNPFVIGKDGTREEVIALYREYLLKNKFLMNCVSGLKGKDLLCFCAPKPCHGDILLELANG